MLTWIRNNWHKLLMLLVSTILSGSLAFVPALHYWREVQKTLARRMVTPIGIFEHDPRTGYAHIASSRGTHKDVDFEVTYTIGKDKERYIPAPKVSLGRILFLGDSFTFGQGVNDDETYPYLLSRLWPNWEIVNKAAMGWGTAHAYLVLSEEMQRAEAPSMVIYAMIPHHILRNYIRRSWVQELWKHDRPHPVHPHFELVEGKLAFQGVIDATGSQPDYPEMFDKEVALTRALLAGMQKMCQQRQVFFAVILLQALPPQVIVDSLAESGIPVLDLTGLRIAGFPHDDHPNPDDHRQIADAISRSFIATRLGEIGKHPLPDDLGQFD